jgi:hypothetical protein
LFLNTNRKRSKKGNLTTHRRGRTGRQERAGKRRELESREPPGGNEVSSPPRTGEKELRKLTEKWDNDDRYKAEKVCPEDN